MSAAWAITRLQLKILRRDPWFLVIMFGMPLVIMPLFKQTMGLSLNDSGFTDASGAEQVVPGQVVMFSFFVAGSTAFSVFREHGWKTWDRLRASAASPTSLLAGFGFPWVLIHVGYQTALYVVGGLLLGLRPGFGSVPALALIIVAYSACVIAMVLLGAASFRTVAQVGGFQNVGAMVFGGLGGALVPLDQLPGWAQAVAPITPAYWAMKGHKEILLEDAGVIDVLPHSAVLLAAAVVFALAASRRFRVDETKQFFA